MLCCMLMTVLMLLSLFTSCFTLFQTYPYASHITSCRHPPSLLFRVSSQPHFFPAAFTNIYRDSLISVLFILLPTFSVTYFCLLVLFSLTQHYLPSHLHYSRAQCCL